MDVSAHRSECKPPTRIVPLWFMPSGSPWHPAWLGYQQGAQHTASYCIWKSSPAISYMRHGESISPSTLLLYGTPTAQMVFFSPSQGLNFSWIADTRRIPKGAHITKSFICSCVKYYTEISSHLHLYFRQKSQGSISQLAITQPGKKLFNE